jgi:hypothetical protein
MFSKTCFEGQFWLLTTLRNSATCSRLNVIENTHTGFFEHPVASRPEDHEVGKKLQKRSTALGIRELPSWSSALIIDHRKMSAWVVL